MIVEVKFISEEEGPVERGPMGDKVIRAIDHAMNGASWEAKGEGWIARG